MLSRIMLTASLVLTPFAAAPPAFAQEEAAASAERETKQVRRPNRRQQMCESKRRAWLEQLRQDQVRRGAIELGDGGSLNPQPIPPQDQRTLPDDKGSLNPQPIPPRESRRFRC